MLEFLICSMVTILPDYLVRRYAQGKRWGADLNLFSVWYELRVGITACLILTVSLITAIFYFHPSTTNVTSFFRTVTILPETPGRVVEVLVSTGQTIEAGAPIFRLDSARQEAAVETARRAVEEIDAQLVLAQSELAVAAAGVAQAQSSLQQVLDELGRKQPLFERGSSAVSERDVEILLNQRGVREGALEAAEANKELVEAKLNEVLPAQRASAQAGLAQAQTELDKTVVYAGTTGTVEQFQLQVGDYINPILRPAGILVPAQHDRGKFRAGFGQISAQVIKPGMVAEIACISKPFTVIPMVVVGVQDVIAAGQFRPSDQVIDIQDRARAGTLTVALEPLYAGQADDIPPGSKCIANAYTSNHDRLSEEGLSTFDTVTLHAIDTVGLVHALILRIQALMLPIQTLVFTGH